MCCTLFRSYGVISEIFSSPASILYNLEIRLCLPLYVVRAFKLCNNHTRFSRLVATGITIFVEFNIFWVCYRGVYVWASDNDGLWAAYFLNFEFKNSALFVLAMGWFPWYMGRKGAHFTSPGWWMRQWSIGGIIIIKGMLKHSENNIYPCYFVHHKCHVDCPGTASGPLRWEAGEWPQNSFTSYFQNVVWSCVLHTSIPNFGGVPLLRLFHELIVSFPV
jgi:hypothetical protein